MSPLAKIEGLRFVRNETNLGFLRSCNRAATMARGRYIHMLNNDTLVLPDAIDALVELLEARSDVAIAGSKLVYPTGPCRKPGGSSGRTAPDGTTAGTTIPICRSTTTFARSTIVPAPR